MLPKIGLVTFEGKDPRSWIQKYEKYFEVYNVQKAQRVTIAGQFLIEMIDAQNWITDGCNSWEAI